MRELRTQPEEGAHHGEIDDGRGSAGPVNKVLWLGVAFAALGLLAIAVPQWATVTAVLMVAWTLLFWGVLGLSLALSIRPAPEWLYAVVLFGGVILLGVLFLLFPAAGIATLTVVLMLVFLMEGVVSILVGLRLSGMVREWGWMVASGIAALAVGLMVMIGWPETHSWFLGLLMGLNFLSTGVSLMVLSRSVRSHHWG